MQYRLATVAAFAAMLQSAMGSNYLLVENYQGSNFFNKMNFFTGGDPTHGYVDYVDQGTAQGAGMLGLSGNTVTFGVDHSNIASGSGRRSVRLSSQRSYTRMLVTIDIAHMPSSICGVWPAFWTLGGNWPNNGEIDIIEGVNSQNVSRETFIDLCRSCANLTPTNYMTLHTSSGCAVTGRSGGLLNPFAENCDAAVNGNAGCSFHETNTLSYGTDMNNNGGAQYAMEWTDNGISIWWWNARNPPPGDMFGGNPNPSNWGPPSSQWAGGGCNWDAHFAQHQLVFDTTFCGDWAGSVFGSDGQCSNKGSCQSWVQNNPGAFSDAYWSIRDLKVYQNNGNNYDRRDLDNATAAAQAEVHAAVEMQRKPVKINDDAKRAEDAVEAANVAQEHEKAEMQRHAKKAAASQVAPSSVAPASRTVDAAQATESANIGSQAKRNIDVVEAADVAQAHEKAEMQRHAKRAAASQVAPSSVAPASRTVDPAQATASANGHAQRDVMAESRRRRYMKA